MKNQAVGAVDLFDPEGVYSPADVERKLGKVVSVRTLANQRAKGVGPKYQKFGRHVFYLGRDLNSRIATFDPKNTSSAKGGTNE